MKKKTKTYTTNPEAVTMADPQLEASLVASAMRPFLGVTIEELATLVAPEDFTDTNAGNVWRAVVACHEQGKDILPTNITAIAKEQGRTIDLRPFLLADGASDIDTLARVVHGMAQRRRITDQLEDLYFSAVYDNEATNEQLLAQLDDVVKDMTAKADKRTEQFREVYTELVRITQDKANGLLPQGVPSGFALIDNKGGLERGELMIVAGRNSNGKTSLVLCMALNAAEQGEAVGIFSLEMTNLQLTTRLTSLMTGVDGESLKRGQLTTEQWGQFARVNDRLPIYFDKRRSTDGDTVINNIKAMVAQLRVQIVVVDYLQLLRGRERERLQQIGGIAHKMEALSKQLGITIILLSQLRRNQPNDPAPKLEELKESGDIADAADSIYLVYRPERHGENVRYPDMSQRWSEYPTKGTALLMCVKNRQGALGGEQLLAFDATTTRFYEREIEPTQAGAQPPTIDEYLGF